MRLILLEKGLPDLNPMAILKRGYSISLHLPEKRVLREASGVHQGDQVMVLLGEGRLTCRVETAEPDSRLSLRKKPECSAPFVFFRGPKEGLLWFRIMMG